jgi:hypothetical protein
MSTKAKRHVHKYHRVKFSFADIWACALPDCNHYLPKHMEATIEGKNSICWSCGEIFQLDMGALGSVKPTCFHCRTGVLREQPVIEAPLDDKLKELLEKLNT